MLQAERHAAASAARCRSRADRADRAPWPWGCARRPAQVGGRPPASCAARCCWSWLTLEVQPPGSQHSPHQPSACRRQACGARTAACAGEARRGTAWGRCERSGRACASCGASCSQRRERPIVARPRAWRGGGKNNLLKQQQQKERACAPDPHDARRVSAGARAGPAPPPRCTLCTARGGLRAPDACAPTGPSTPCRR